MRELSNKRKKDVILIIVWLKTSRNMLLLSVYIIILTDQPHREEDQNMDGYTDVQNVG
jgi:hypothetical protein